jgi:hypothetical protein
MTPWTISAALAVGLLAGAAWAEDNEAGVPLSPAEAAGTWTVSSGGRDLCQLSLGAAHTVKAPAACAEALTGAPTAWAATRDGMSLNTGDGRVVIAFHRWSNSLFVSHRSSGVDIQLRRGGPA